MLIVCFLLSHLCIDMNNISLYCCCSALIYSIRFIPIIHLDIPISILSSKFRSAFFSALSHTIELVCGQFCCHFETGWASSCHTQFQPFLTTFHIQVLFDACICIRSALFIAPIFKCLLIFSHVSSYIRSCRIYLGLLYFLMHICYTKRHSDNTIHLEFILFVTGCIVLLGL